MPPRKKQRTDTDAINVPRRTKRATTRAIHDNGGISSAGVVNEQQDSGVDPGIELTAVIPVTPKRVVLKGRLQTLPDIAIEIQLMVSTNFRHPRLHIPS